MPELKNLSFLPTDGFPKVANSPRIQAIQTLTNRASMTSAWGPREATKIELREVADRRSSLPGHLAFHSEENFSIAGF